MKDSKRAMLKGFWLIPAAMLSAAALVGCKEDDASKVNSLPLNEEKNITGDFSLTVTLDKTEASIGDTVTATVVFENLSGRDIEAELPDWLAEGGKQSKEEILLAGFVPEGIKVYFPSIKFDPRPKILIESGAVIERQFEFAMTKPGNFEVHAGAYFVNDAGEPPYGIQIETRIKVTVR